MMRRVLLALALIVGAIGPAFAGWTKTVYCQFPDYASAKAAAEAIGANFDAAGNPTSGSENYALVAPITEWVTRPTYDADGNVIDPGEQRPGYWAMMRFNLDTELGRQAYDAVQATGTVRTLESPSNVFQ